MKRIPSSMIIFISLFPAFSVYIPQVKAQTTAYLTDYFQLTTSSERDREPSWSPDGSRIAWFAFDSSGRYRHIWSMKADGSDKRQLTFGNVIDESTDYSPNGTKIVFTRYVRNIETPDTMTMNVDGSDVRQITSSGLGRFHIRYSHDGSKWVFSYGGAGTNIWEIHIMKSDGTNEIALVTDLPSSSRGQWSPDDRYIVYDGRPNGIWVVSASPPYEKKLVYATTEPVYSANFSPDGKYILFQMTADLHLWCWKKLIRLGLLLVYVWVEFVWRNICQREILRG